MTLRTHFTLLIGTVGVLTLAIHTGALLTSEARHLNRQMERAHWTDTNHLAQACGEALINRNDLALFNFLKTLEKSDDLEEAMCLAPNGQVLLHNDLARMGTPAELFGPDLPQKNILEKPGGEKWLYTTQVFREGHQLGLARVVYDGAKARQRVRVPLMQNLRRSIGLTGIILCVVHVLSWGAASALTRPILGLVKGSRRLAQGDWSVRVPTRAPGELAQLALEFNQMSAKLGELDRLKDQFVHTVSHDLRNPLSAIATSARVLKHNGMTEPSRSLVEVIESSAKRLGTMVNNILDLARVREGHLTFNMESCSVLPLLKEIGALFDPLAKESRKDFVVDVPEDLPPLWADQEKILRVLLNLLANAFKFTDRGDKIRLSAELTKSGKVLFAVSDSGRGIAPNRLPHLWEPFRATDGADEDTQKHQGAGLGLSIVKVLVEGHGGTVNVTSAPGQGTTFSFLVAVAGAIP